MKIIKPYKRQKGNIMNVKAEATHISELLKLMNPNISSKQQRSKHIYITLNEKSIFQILLVLNNTLSQLKTEMIFKTLSNWMRYHFAEIVCTAKLSKNIINNKNFITYSKKLCNTQCSN